MIDIRIARPVPQIPARRAARFDPETVRRAPVAAEGLFPIARQILEAETDQRRAAILLRVPDDTVATKGDLLKQACAEAGFTMGATFLELRIGALTATRDRDGKLPEQYLRTFETWRRGFVALANGVKA